MIIRGHPERQLREVVGATTKSGPMLLSAITDLSNLQREKDHIRAALREKDILLGDIHHRSGNIPQIDSSLLDLQSEVISDLATRNMVRDSRNRIPSMALIHDTLSGSMDLAMFVNTFLPGVIASFDVDSSRLRIIYRIDPIPLPIDIAIPCRLLLNELLSNALTHACPKQDKGEILISLTRDAHGGIRLSVSDNGIGMPDLKVMNAAGGLGMKLIGILRKQINDTVPIQGSDPAEFAIRFPCQSMVVSG